MDSFFRSAARVSLAGAFLFVGPCKRAPSVDGDAGAQTAAPESLAGLDAAPASLAGLVAAPGAFVSIAEPASAFAVADANGDGVDDVLAVASIDSRETSERRLIAIDGRSRALLWTSAPIRPWGPMPSEARILVLAAAGHVAVAAGWTTLHVFDVRTGLEKPSIDLAGIPGRRWCDDPSAPSRFYLSLYEGGPLGFHEVEGAMLDLAASKALAAPRPAWCRPSWVATDPDLKACGFEDRLETSRAKCSGPTSAPKTEDRFEARYVLTAPEATLAVGNGPRIVFDSGASDSGFPEIVRFDPSTKKPLWTRTFADETHGNPRLKDEHRVTKVDVAPEGVLVVLDVVQGAYEHAARIVLLDAKSGEPRWERAIERPVVGARVASGRVYLATQEPSETVPYGADPKGRLDVLDASNGAPIFRVGGGQKQ